MTSGNVRWFCAHVQILVLFMPARANKNKHNKEWPPGLDCDELHVWFAVARWSRYVCAPSRCGVATCGLAHGSAADRQAKGSIGKHASSPALLGEQRS